MSVNDECWCDPSERAVTGEMCTPCTHRYEASDEYEEDCAIGGVLNDIEAEYRRAKTWPPFNSAHEGFAVLNEEFDELKAHVWTNQKKRDIDAMRKEAIQVAAMALRFALDVCNEETGRK